MSEARKYGPTGFVAEEPKPSPVRAHPPNEIALILRKLFYDGNQGDYLIKIYGKEQVELYRVTGRVEYSPINRLEEVE